MLLGIAGQVGAGLGGNRKEGRGTGGCRGITLPAAQGAELIHLGSVALLVCLKARYGVVAGLSIATAKVVQALGDVTWRGGGGGGRVRHRKAPPPPAAAGGLTGIAWHHLRHVLVVAQAAGARAVHGAAHKVLRRLGGRWTAGPGITQHGPARRGHGRAGQQLVRVRAERSPDLVLELGHVAAVAV